MAYLSQQLVIIVKCKKGETMKTLIILSLSFVTLNVMANSNNFDCSAQAKNSRERVECTSSVLKDQTKLALNCKEQVKQKHKKDGITY